MPSILKKIENWSQLSSSYLSNYLNIGIDLEFKYAYVYMFERMFQFLPSPTGGMASLSGQQERIIKNQKWGKAEDRYQETYSILS